VTPLLVEKRCRGCLKTFHVVDGKWGRPLEYCADDCPKRRRAERGRPNWQELRERRKLDNRCRSMFIAAHRGAYEAFKEAYLTRRNAGGKKAG
jgi:hypothetical protein